MLRAGGTLGVGGDCLWSAHEIKLQERGHKKTLPTSHPLKNIFAKR